MFVVCSRCDALLVSVSVSVKLQESSVSISEMLPLKMVKAQLGWGSDGQTARVNGFINYSSLYIPNRFKFNPRITVLSDLISIPAYIHNSQELAWNREACRYHSWVRTPRCPSHVERSPEIRNQRVGRAELHTRGSIEVGPTRIHCAPEALETERARGSRSELAAKERRTRMWHAHRKMLSHSWENQADTRWDCEVLDSKPTVPQHRSGLSQINWNYLKYITT